MNIYTDGSCNSKFKKGGWACILVNDNEEIHIGGFKKNTTNNRMEMTGIIIGIRAMLERYGIINCNIISDSQYVINGITDWIKSWKVKNWKNYNNEDIKNMDLWKMLDKLNNNLYNWIWVRGHNGNKYNEIADEIAKRCQEKQEGYFKVVKR